MILKEKLKNLSQSDSVLILGYGITGEALAEFCDQKKWNYYIWEDKKTVSRSSVYFQGQISSLQNKNIRFIFHSPGVSLKHPAADWAHAEAVPILSETELASYDLQGELIGVTGTNGKSTTVTLLAELLKNTGISVSLKGNIGKPLITAVGEPPKSFYVVEESSYQLELTQSLHHKFGICLNITEDHLDWHGNFQNYARAKAKIFANSTRDDVFVYNADDPECERLSQKSPAKNFAFSLVKELPEGGFLKENNLVLRFENKEFLFDTKEIALKGLQNFENVLAALIVALKIQSDEKTLASYRHTLKHFSGLPHRMQKFHTHDGIEFYDDSKGTNVQATAMALSSFSKNVILIAGGLDKGGDYGVLKGLIKAKVKTLILLGQAKDKLFEIFQGQTKVLRVQDMAEAVQEIFPRTQNGDIVLLSPACASFDQYKNYAERGDHFQRLVLEKYDR